MEEQKKAVVTLSDEQLDALAQSLLPVMQEFFNSERGRRIWEEYLREIEQSSDKVAGLISHPKVKKIYNLSL